LSILRAWPATPPSFDLGTIFSYFSNRTSLWHNYPEHMATHRKKAALVAGTAVPMGCTVMAQTAYSYRDSRMQKQLLTKAVLAVEHQFLSY